MERSNRVPVLGVTAFAIAVVAGLCAAFALLVDLATGISGFYLNGWAIAFFVFGGATVVLFGVAVGVGVAALHRRGGVERVSRRRLGLALGELAAIAVLVTAVHYDVGGDAFPAFTDLLVVAFLGGLINWNFAIWRRLQTPEQEQET